MARWLVPAIAVAAFCFCLSAAHAGPFGIGVVIGEPTGVTFKTWMGGDQAIDAAAAWSFVDGTSLHFHMDYLYHKPGPPEMAVPGLLIHFGLGGRLKVGDDDKHGDGDNRLGIRVPVGLDYLFAKSHLELFFEVAPLLDLAPETDFLVNGGVGLRYYLGGRPSSRR